jgi:hypothetical protein
MAMSLSLAFARWALGPADRTTIAMAEWTCGEAHRFDSTGLPFPCRVLCGPLAVSCKPHFSEICTINTSEFDFRYGQEHLRRVLRSYARYYNEMRTHRSLDKDAPLSRPVQETGSIKSHALVGGLHYIGV